MQIKNFHHDELQIDKLATGPGEAWCIFGENRSGIDRLIDLLGDKLQNSCAEILQLPENPGILTFQVQQEIFEEELRNDDTDFLDKVDPGTLVREFLSNYENHLPLLKAFGMDHCLDLGYRQLSSGQCRKLLFLQKLTGGANTLIIQNPFDGLDEKSCQELNLALQQLPARGIELILLVNAATDIPSWCTHHGLIREGRLERVSNGEQLQLLITRNRESHRKKHTPITGIFLKENISDHNQREELVFLRDGFAGYGSKKLFTGLDLTIYTGDHTLITGPNGCGKSTLLDIITGDNPKCYANSLRVFGRKRGTGESIWDIKKHMGIVSPTLHRDHRIPGNATHVILSGLHDSIGLYKKVQKTEIETARRWLDWIDLGDQAETPFRKMTFAEQRLVLIARALIKRPKLLILDEPTQGLDDVHRNHLLDLLEKIAAGEMSTILFVSHRKDEQRGFLRNRIKLDLFPVYRG
jgi:molybdate transport system ATP-binding protein